MTNPAFDQNEKGIKVLLPRPDGIAKTHFCANSQSITNNSAYLRGRIL